MNGRVDPDSVAGLLLGGMVAGALLATALMVGALLTPGSAEPPSPPRAAAEPSSPPVRRIELPVQGIARERLVDSFDEARGVRVHHAIDISAPRNAPVQAVDAGTIVRLAKSPAGGITLYQRDAAGSYCYYYAHLDRYADGIGEGRAVVRGDVIGYVGSTGNAPARSPHLHFAVLRTGPDRSCWSATPVDPYPLLR